MKKIAMTIIFACGGFISGTIIGATIQLLFDNKDIEAIKEVHNKEMIKAYMRGRADEATNNAIKNMDKEDDGK